jgi:hypothetical protein
MNNGTGGWAGAWPIAILAASVLVVEGAAWAAQKLTVIQKDAAIRPGKRPFSTPLTVVHERDQLTLVGREPPWVRVQWKQVEGWIHESAVTEREKPIFATDTVASGVQPTERSGGARGFDSEVENQYRKDRPNLEPFFSIVGKIFDWSFPEGDVRAFVAAGKLADVDGEGGGR